MIAQGRQVRLHLGLWLADGTEVLNSFEDAPLALRIGDGTLATGLEALLLGLAVGTDMQMCTEGAVLFGPPDPDLVQVIDPRDLPAGFSAAPGQVLAFAAPGGQETAGTVRDWTPAGLWVDFNPPLIGRALRMRVQVLAVGDDAD